VIEAQRKSLILFSILLIGLLMLWWPTVAHWFSIVWSVDVFAHGLLVPIISAVMIWSRRDGLRAIKPTPDPLGGLVIVVACFIWLGGAVLDTALLAHLALAVVLQGLVILVFGRVLYRFILFPMIFLFLAVPFGASVIEPMQHGTARIVIFALDILGADFRADGVLIELPSGLYEVAQACAGVKFLFTSIVTGVLLANMVFKSWQRRAVIIVTSIALPIIANALRVLGILGIAELSSQDFAKDVDHIVYGWVFLSMVLLALIAFAYRISDRTDTEAEFKTLPLSPQFYNFAKRVGWTSILLLAATGLLAPNQFASPYREGPPESAQFFKHVPAGFRQLENSTPIPKASFFNADLIASDVFRRGGIVFRAQYGQYEPLGAGRRLFQTANRVAPSDWQELTGMRKTLEVTCGMPIRQMVFMRNNVRALVWATDWVGSYSVNNSLQEKLRTLYARVLTEKSDGARFVLTAMVNDDFEPVHAVFSKFISTLVDSSDLWENRVGGEEGNRARCAE
jgi:exosortase A